MQILNIAGYKFTALTELDDLKSSFQNQCVALGIKGTILLSQEGININLAAKISALDVFKAALTLDKRFADMVFHESYSAVQPFRFLKIKLKDEIITFKQPNLQTTKTRAPSIAPEKLKEWLDEKQDFILLDTRNEFEVNLGTFATAVSLPIQHFSEFPTAVKQIERDKPIVMFCTGGIRCEKAALYMQDQGFSDVYQLDGGILGYFARVGGEHYTGACFVFDEREIVTADSFAK